MQSTNKPLSLLISQRGALTDSRLEQIDTIWITTGVGVENIFKLDVESEIRSSTNVSSNRERLPL